MEELDVDIIVLTETKLRRNENVEIKGYKTEKLNNETAAGGVIIYIKDALKTKLIKICSQTDIPHNFNIRTLIISRPCALLKSNF